MAKTVRSATKSTARKAKPAAKTGKHTGKATPSIKKVTAISKEKPAKIISVKTKKSAVQPSKKKSTAKVTVIATPKKVTSKKTIKSVATKKAATKKVATKKAATKKVATKKVVTKKVVAKQKPTPIPKTVEIAKTKATSSKKSIKTKPANKTKTVLIKQTPVVKKQLTDLKSEKQSPVIKRQGLKITSILITQPRPESDKSPYFDLAKKYNINLEFHPFIRVEGLSGKDFRKQRIDLNEYTAIIFTSRNAVDNFFRICEELKVKVSQDMKYFCITEAVALYLQKFILYRKRKVFYSADGSSDGLIDVINKHKMNEKFIVPTSDSGKTEVRDFLARHKASFVEATFFKTVSNDIAHVMRNAFDMIVFFSPFSVQTLFEHSPQYKQNGTLIGAFGPTTSKAIEEVGLRLDVKAPAPNAPSMVSALEKFLEEIAS
ncbi:MAG: uroporphyrinogen-III synthase [Bacteroidetes bacterium]|nr:uroporphyrinogen-III synthase [Bacteroidota bacterium]MBS1741174.1 uroporphyrinogen-III synthase [Bacteroidota bacterium]